MERELLEDGMANVMLYTPPATRQSDYERDEFEQSIETMEPRRLFQAGYKEDGLAATTDGTTTMTDGDADANKLNEDDQMHTDVCMPATWDSNGDYGATELNNVPTNMTLIDSGTSRHMLGSEGIKFVANVQETDHPIQLETAAGPMELGLEGDALLRNGSVLRNCLLNVQTELNLLSEGLMRTESDWTFNSIERGLKVLELRMVTKQWHIEKESWTTCHMILKWSNGHHIQMVIKRSTLCMLLLQAAYTRSSIKYSTRSKGIGPNVTVVMYANVHSCNGWVPSRVAWIAAHRGR